MDNSVSAFQQIIQWFKMLTGSAGSAMNMINSLSFEFNGQSYGVWTLLTFGGLSALIVFALVKWVVS